MKELMFVKRYLAVVLVAFCIGSAITASITAVAALSGKSTQTLPALLRAWGKPDQQIDGAQVSPHLKGATCYLYQARRVFVCG